MTLLRQLTIRDVPCDQAAHRPAAAFAAAIAGADAGAARAVCAAGAWEAGGDTPRRLFAQAVRKRLMLHPTLVGRLHQGRASIRALLTRRGEETPLRDLWLLMIVEDGDWKLAAPTKSRSVVGLFLRHELTVPAAVSDLPPSAEAEVWAQGTLSRLARGTLSATEKGSAAVRALVCRSPASTRPRITQTVALAGRAAVRFTFTDPNGPDPPRLWVVLEQPGEADPWRPLRASPGLSLETLLDGLEVPWARRAPSEKMTMTAASNE